MKKYMAFMLIILSPGLVFAQNQPDDVALIDGIKLASCIKGYTSSFFFNSRSRTHDDLNVGAALLKEVCVTDEHVAILYAKSRQLGQDDSMADIRKEIGDFSEDIFRGQYDDLSKTYERKSILKKVIEISSDKSIR